MGIGRGAVVTLSFPSAEIRQSSPVNIRNSFADGFPFVETLGMELIEIPSTGSAIDIVATDHEIRHLLSKTRPSLNQSHSNG